MPYHWFYWPPYTAISVISVTGPSRKFRIIVTRIEAVSTEIVLQTRAYLWCGQQALAGRSCGCDSGSWAEMTSFVSSLVTELRSLVTAAEQGDDAWMRGCSVSTRPRGHVDITVSSLKECFEATQFITYVIGQTIIFSSCSFFLPSYGRPM